MYRYDVDDQRQIEARSREFRGQVARRLAGRLSEEEFKPLRLMNGLYHQLHSYMLRVAVPYGVLSADQMRKLAFIADRFDRGYGHFTTRQNIQFNWSQLTDVPEILDHLAAVGMHAIQTSGNCIRNVTTDAYADAAADEFLDPRPMAELIRQWSTLHPEFLYLPRKFKIALSGAATDRAATRVHDIGLRLYRDHDGSERADIWVGGGLGRTPRIARPLREGVPMADLLPWLEAVLRVYNLHGRRDNKYKARIKILVDDLGIEAFAEQVADTYRAMDRGAFAGALDELARIRGRFTIPAHETLDDRDDHLETARVENPAFADWLANNVAAHRQAGYAIASISLKPRGGIPGDASAAQMVAVADLAERYSFSEIRVSHRQNLVLPHVRKRDLFDLWRALTDHGLAEANLNRPSDIISCPGLDYCSLATARSIPVAQALSALLRDREGRDELHGLSVNISGCINACGHHHIADIGILGLEKNGREYYQITLGGRNDDKAAIGEVLGRGLSREQVPTAVDGLVSAYLALRRADERLTDTYSRVGPGPFKEAAYVGA